MIVNRQRRIPLATESLAAFLDRTGRILKFPEGSVTVRLISDSAMARLNKEFRGKRGPTDVLSFPAEVPTKVPAKAPRNGTRDSYVGDIAIAPETARRNARRFSRSLPVELRILILHGMLHLAGYDHETDGGEMAQLERRLRRRLQVGSR
jgi:probable rRNA maturation factor